MGDKYEHPTQIPAAYPGLENEASREEWLEDGKSPSGPRNIRKKEMVDPVEDEARKKEALDKGGRSQMTYRGPLMVTAALAPFFPLS